MFNNLLIKYYADDIPLNGVSVPGGKTVASRDDGTSQHELVMLEYADPSGQPIEVSVANPLPVLASINTTGLATSANQASEIAALNSIAAEDFATAANQATEIAGLAAILAKLSSDPATQTTLAAILAKIIANPATDTLQTTGNTTLASILAKIIAAPATEAKQDTIITALNNIDAGSAAALGQALMAASVPVVIASNQTAIPISGTVAVTGAGDATAANQTTQITAEQAIQAAVQIMDDWDETDRAKVNLIAGQAGVDGGSGASTAKTLRTILATDQAAIPVTFSGLATDNTTLYSNTLAVTGAITGIETTGYQSIIFSFTGVWVGLLLIEGSEDNSTWEQKIVLDVNEFAMQDVINENGIFQIKSSSKYIRINVQQVSGTITALIVGRTVPGLNAADSIAFAMDKSWNMPLYIEETASKKDITNALIPSDAMPVGGINVFAQATSAVIFKVDTTGYQSVVVQCLTFGSSATIQTSNDGVVWYSLSGYNPNTLSASSATLSAVGIWEYPVIGRFCRGLMTGASFTNYLVYLRQKPVNPFNLLTGGAINIQAIGGSAVTATASLNSSGSATGQTGYFAVGSSIAPGSTTVPYPLIIGGREAPSDGALGGKVRTLLTDTLGRAIVTGSIPAGAGIQNQASVPTMELSQFEGQSQIELLAQVLLELRILNQNISELPIALQSQNGTLDEPLKFRNDPSVFAN